MDTESEDEQPLNDTFIDIVELKKEFSARNFARSLLPNFEKSENDETESTFYGEFLDDLERKIANDEISPVEFNYFESLRTWSNVKFKKKQKQSLVPKDESCNVPELEEASGVSHTKGCSEGNEDINIIDILSNFLQEENKFSVEFSNLLFKSELVDLTFIKSDRKKFFRFYYLDAYEKLFGEESSVYLFGRTYCNFSKSYKSCCVIVRPLNRRIFVLPKISVENGKNAPLNTNLILKEFYKLALKPLGIQKFKYRFLKKRDLEDVLSAEKMMMEIQYSASYPPVNQKLVGTTFSKVFGANSNCFENFLLEKHIKGPCWLDVTNPKKATKMKTWCFFEVSCTTEEISLCTSINQSASPPLTLLSFHMRTVDKSNNVALISWAVNFNYGIWSENLNIVEEKTYCTFAFVNSDQDAELPEILRSLKRTKIKSMRSEKDLLALFLNEFQKVDPDIIVGYEIQNKDFHKFIDRLESLKVADQNKLSKFRVGSSNSDTRKFLLSGRLICDLRHLAKEFSLSRNYELNELFEMFIGIKKENRVVVDLGEIISPSGKFHNIIDLKEKFLEIFVVSTNEPIYLLKLVLKTNIISLAVKLTEICGNTLSKTFSGGISKRTEYLLLHAFHQENYILPNKMFHKKSKDVEEGELLEGGLVLEPKVGFYNNYILLMDFQSLYPSIIHEFNLCISHNFHNLESTNMSLGVLPKLMNYLISKRKTVKDEMNILEQNSAAYFRYQIYQTALKLSANGIYGCLASQYFRFYCPSIAKDITRRARKILSDAVHLLERNGFEIIYGDTDSMMVNTKSKDLFEAQEMGQVIRKIISVQYSSVNLSIDAIFEKLLLITKKKYAAIAVNIQNPQIKGERIVKGLDIIRYDWPPYVCQIGKMVIDLILTDFSIQDKCEKIKEKLNQVKEDLMRNKVPINSLVITKYLTQDPKNYSQKTSYPHVQVAIRCNENYQFNFKSGDAVSFIMSCDKNENNSQKAYHIEELKSSNHLVIDGSHYLWKQIYPFISNICVHIGLQDEEVKQCLGLKKQPPEKINQFEMNKIEFERRDPFIFNCLKCGQSIVFDKNDQDQDDVGFSYRCQNPQCDYCPLENINYLKNKLVITVISYIRKYYKYEMKCTNKKCSHITRRIPLSYTKEKNNCPVCDKGVVLQVFNESDLFLQLEYFKYIFKYVLVLTSDEKKKEVIKSLIQLLDYYESHSGFLSVNITELFSTL